MLNGWPPLRWKYLRRRKPSTRTHIFLTNAQRGKMFTEAFVTQMSTKTFTLTTPLPPPPTTPRSLCPQLQIAQEMFIPAPCSRMSSSSCISLGTTAPGRAGGPSSLRNADSPSNTRWWLPPPSMRFITGTRPAPPACSRRGGRGR